MKLIKVSLAGDLQFPLSGHFKQKLKYGNLYGISIKWAGNLEARWRTADPHTWVQIPPRPSFIMKIKNLSLQHYDELLRLWKEAGLPHKPKGRDKKEEIKKQLESYSDLFIGAFEGEKLIASVIGSDDGRRGWINRLAVHPDCQGKGVASILLKEIEDRLRKRGRKIICVLVEDWNKKSIKFFVKNNYILHKDIYYLSKRENLEV